MPLTVARNIAEKLFISQGYEAVHVDDIRAASHLSKGGFYHHFRAKDDLLGALARRDVERLATAVECRSGTLPADRALVEVFRLGSVFVDGDATLFRALGIVRGGEPSSSAPLALYLDAFDRELARRLAPLLEQIIAAGMAAGNFRAVDAPMTAELVLAINSHANRRIARGEWSLATAARHGANALDALGAHLGATFAASSARTLARTRAASKR